MRNYEIYTGNYYVGTTKLSEEKANILRSEGYVVIFIG